MDRDFGYFGYQLDDFDSLYSMQRSVWVVNADNAAGKSDNNKISIGCKRNDGLADAFLDVMNILPLTTDLNLVAKEIERIIPDPAKNR